MEVRSRNGQRAASTKSLWSRTRKWCTLPLKRSPTFKTPLAPSVWEITRTATRCECCRSAATCSMHFVSMRGCVCTPHAPCAALPLSPLLWPPPSPLRSQNSSPSLVTLFISAIKAPSVRAWCRACPNFILSGAGSL